MKKIVFMCLLLPLVFRTKAQINGNRNIITKVFPLEEFNRLEISYGAKLRIDKKGKSEIRITTDSNVMEYISFDIYKGKLRFDQKKWIEPSQRMIVEIGAPALSKITFDAHGDFEVVNLNEDHFEVYGEVGKLQLTGSVKALKIKNDMAYIEASNLKVETATIKIRDSGTVRIRQVNELHTHISKSGHLEIVSDNGQVSKYSNNEFTAGTMTEGIDSTIRFFHFKLKNNSWNRHHYLVVGPKPDGSTFSYGFPMNPGQVLKKYWTNGTMVYKVNAMGVRKLVLTLSLADEGKLVEIYQ